MNSTTTASLQAVGITSSLLLSGIYAGSSLLTMPILYRLPSATALDFWAEFFNRGFVTVVPLAVAGTVTFATTAYLEPEKRRESIAASVFVISTLAWTQLTMMGGIDRLLQLNNSSAELTKAGSGEVLALLQTWTWKNTVRSVLAGLGGIAGIYGLTQ
jgi:hypothetical protein